MKKILTTLLILLTTFTSPAAVMRGQDGRWYGNVCITKHGWQEIPWQLVGSTCYSPMWRQYGFVANI